MKTVFISSAIALLFAGSAMAADMSTSWDTNKDGIVSADEYKAAMQNDAMFDAWDSDHDGMLSSDEFAAGNWKTYDSDKDNQWNADELSAWKKAAVRSGASVSQ